MDELSNSQFFKLINIFSNQTNNSIKDDVEKKK